MKPCSFEAGQEGFYRIKHPASPFRLTGDFEGAVGMRSEDECLTNISNRHFVQWPKCKSSLAEAPCASVVGRRWQLFMRAQMCLGYSAVQPCLSPQVVLPRSGERKGATTPSRLASTARALLYPSLPNTARAAPWDLTNPLLFHVPRALAVLLIPPAPFFLTLLMLRCVGPEESRGISCSPLFLGPTGQICPNGAYIHASPLTWPQWVSMPFLLAFNLGEPPCSGEVAGFYSSLCIVSGYVN